MAAANLRLRTSKTGFPHFYFKPQSTSIAYQQFPASPSMDDDRISLVLAKTSDLRSRITSCVPAPTNNRDHDDIDYDEECLLNIRDALDSLEGQLSSLQVLQQQQWYEKEAALSEIEYSQKKLLKVLEEYKGKDLEVIHEAMAFARETDDNSDLLLPPYPNRPPRSVLADNAYLSTFIFTRKASQKGTTTRSASKVPQPNAKNIHKLDSNQAQPRFKPIKFLIGTAARTVLTIVGMVTILNFAGFQPSLRKRDDGFKSLDIFQLLNWNNNEKTSSVECPPGKVPVIEYGVTRCVVKERVEIPFQTAVATPDVSYGCG